MTVTEFDHPEHGWKWTKIEVDWINARIAAEIAAERERCAKVVEQRHPDGHWMYDTRRECADAIRKGE